MPGQREVPCTKKGRKVKHSGLNPIGFGVGESHNHVSCLEAGHVSGPQPVNLRGTKEKEKLKQECNGQAPLLYRKRHARHSLDELPRNRRGAAGLVNFNPVGVKLRSSVESRRHPSESGDCKGEGDTR